MRDCLSSRLQLRMCSEEEGCVSRGAEKRHSRLWWVFIYLFIYISSFLNPKTKTYDQCQKVREMTNQAGSFQRFTRLDCFHTPWRCDDILSLKKWGQMMLTVPAAFCKYNILSENYFLDGSWWQNLKNRDSCYFSGTQKMKSHFRWEEIERSGHIQSVPAHTCQRFITMFSFESAEEWPVFDNI